MTSQSKDHEPLSNDVEKLIHDTIGCCIAVHRELGPGFSEKVYVRAICLELTARGLSFETERRFDIRYRDEVIGSVRSFSRSRRSRRSLPFITNSS
jgi:hypothetical protein